MGKQYVAWFNEVSVSTPQDLVELVPNTTDYKSSFAKILRVWVMDADTTLPTQQQLNLRCRRLTSIVAGSGGSSADPLADDPGDGVTYYQSLQNCTTKATGTTTWNYAFACYLYTGADSVFSDPCIINGADGFVFELLSTVSTPVLLSGGILYEQFGTGL